jgi:tRNA pseudouridine55 synthase
VTIYALDIGDWQPPILTLDIECGKGTYIRSLAYDLGERLGCGAYLRELVRTRSGPFTLADSITLEELALAALVGEQHTVAPTLTPYLHPADSALQGYPAIVLPAEMAERVRHGNTFEYHLPEQVTKNARLARVYDEERNFIAIARWDETRRTWQPDKVFR